MVLASAFRRTCSRSSLLQPKLPDMGSPRNEEIIVLPNGVHKKALANAAHSVFTPDPQLCTGGRQGLGLADPAQHGFLARAIMRMTAAFLDGRPAFTEQQSRSYTIWQAVIERGACSARIGAG